MKTATRNVSISEVLDALESLMDPLGYWYYEINELPCCASCGMYGVPEEYGNKYVFLNQQMYDSAVDRETGELFGELYLSWGSGVDFEIVQKAFADRGMKLTGGNPSLKLMVAPERVK